MDADVNPNATASRLVVSSSPGYPRLMLLEANRDSIDTLDVGYVLYDVFFEACSVHCGIIPSLFDSGGTGSRRRMFVYIPGKRTTKKRIHFSVQGALLSYRVIVRKFSADDAWPLHCTRCSVSRGENSGLVDTKSYLALY
jgi:hypothetical protein